MQLGVQSVNVANDLKCFDVFPYWSGTGGEQREKIFFYFLTKFSHLFLRKNLKAADVDMKLKEIVFRFDDSCNCNNIEKKRTNSNRNETLYATNQ